MFRIVKFLLLVSMLYSCGSVVYYEEEMKKGNIQNSNNLARDIFIALGVIEPVDLSYTGSPFTFSVGATIGSIAPVMKDGNISSCVSNPGLPSGILLNVNTCVISGTPKVSQPATSYVITASTTNKSANTTINITITGPVVILYLYAEGTPRNGVLVDRNFADNLCRTKYVGSAVSVGSSLNAHALISFSSMDLVSQFPLKYDFSPKSQIKDTSGLFLIDSWTSFMAGSYLAIQLNSIAIPTTSGFYWLGTWFDGTATANCNNWTNGTSGSQGNANCDTDGVGPRFGPCALTNCNNLMDVVCIVW